MLTFWFALYNSVGRQWQLINLSDDISCLPDPVIESMLLTRLKNLPFCLLISVESPLR